MKHLPLYPQEQVLKVAGLQRFGLSLAAPVGCITHHGVVQMTEMDPYLMSPACFDDHPQ